MKSLLAFLIGWSLGFAAMSGHEGPQAIAVVFTIIAARVWLCIDRRSHLTGSQP